MTAVRYAQASHGFGPGSDDNVPVIIPVAFDGTSWSKANSVNATHVVVFSSDGYLWITAQGEIDRLIPEFSGQALGLAPGVHYPHPTTVGEWTTENPGGTNLRILVMDSMRAVVRNTAPTNIPLGYYLDRNQRFTTENVHGGLLALSLADTLSSGSSISVDMGSSKIALLVNAGTDLVGTITITGTSVDRDTGTETASDTETISINGTSGDTSTTDAEGNPIYGWDGAYISSNWWVGSVTISTSDVNLSDVDVYQISFEQFNDTDSVVLTLDVTCKTTNANAWGYWYLYSVVVGTDNKFTLAKISEVSIEDADTTVAAQAWRRRRGNIGSVLAGKTDGIFLQQHLGPTNQNYFDDISCKVWIQQ
jgi:hypothetical protein